MNKSIAERQQMGPKSRMTARSEVFFFANRS
jgi:hypothetical protein